MNLGYGSLKAAAPAKVQNAQRLNGSSLRIRVFTLLALLDSLCIVASYFAASLIYKPASSGNQWLAISLAILPVFLVIAINCKAYSAEVLRRPTKGALRGLQALTVAAGAVIMAAFFLKSSEMISRLTYCIGFMISFAVMALVRDIFLRKAARLFGNDPFAVALICDGDQTIPQDGFSLVLADPDIDPDNHCPMMFDRLAHALKGVDRVVVSCKPERRLSWVTALKGANIHSEIVIPELQLLAPLSVGHWNGRTTLVIAQGPLSMFDRLLKRTLDLAASSMALVLMAPFLLIVAIAIKLDSPGPVFFVQTRIGRGNRMFQMLKFRSMRVNKTGQDGTTSTARDDDRITRVGRIIRSTSIDELPQLINVLIGDMSIVGPRPHAIGSRAQNKLFWEIDERYWHRHATKPGLTGLAQVRGFRGATDHESDLTNRLQADLEYLNHWSIWKDFQIIIMTFKVLVHKNAY
ncbi:exopolysaccharide biosynthesis polyprenyl glycosylphosphotransferase [Sphingosinithalassobacter portus]|uniref:exopolysaccharide biosynthesis polyprenyl glycosylphosphotransferase n=1 Tax=Stakelama portus TaxID=2676234 RepID=UPI00137A747B|nr:exopolysaccharide biosynthesis polyprenyl glycosylphosphotransferase [Sphingosinithalassobacter portus]